MVLYYFQVAPNYVGNGNVDGTPMSHFVNPAFGQQQQQQQQQQQSLLPQLNDNDLLVQPVIEEELLFPASMVFVDNNTLLVTQKNDGNVIAVINGTFKKQPVISVEVNNKGFKGLLGIEVMEKPSSSNHAKFVFLYSTELYMDRIRQETESTDTNGIKKTKYW